MRDDAFRSLIERVRAGDQQAAEAVVRQYEAEIRREVRLRLGDARVRRVFDSMDVCQSVLASFFLRAATGQYELEDPRDLLQLLVRMTRNKVIDVVRQQQSARRRPRGTAPVGTDVECEPTARDPTPSEQVSLAELEQEFRLRLSDDERQLAEARAAGRTWAEIAREAGDSPEALRKRLARATDRVCSALGVD